jgi:DNA mismatch repair protein MutS
LPQIKAAGSKLDAKLADQFANIHTHDSVAAELKSALADDLPTFFRDCGVIRPGYDGALDHMNGMAHGAKETIAGLQAEYAHASGVSLLKIKFNTILGYHIEVPATRADKLFALPDLFIHRQTMAGNIRFTTARLIDLDHDVRGAAEKSAAIEADLIARLIGLIRAVSDDLLGTADLLAALDVWAALADCAELYGWTRPMITDDRTFSVRGGRHPVVEKILKARADPFVKNDCDLSCETAGGRAIALLTGPNMAGKSTYLRQNALIVVLAHLGSFVPADAATIGICDQLFSRVGASDNLAAGQSTFMVEMVETANILNRMTEKSFIIFDEIGRGTATFDGLSIAWAVLEFLDKPHPRTLFATHYHELTELATNRQTQNVRCLTIDVTEHHHEIIFLHKIIDGVAKSSYGIHVALMAGMPPSVIARATDVLQGLESGNKGQCMRAPAPIDAQTPVQSKVSEPPKKSQMTLF